MTFQLFRRLLVTVSLLISVIITSQLTEAYQLAATTLRQETISGYIQSIDQATGVIAIETATGIVQVEAAPEAVANWKEGDPVVVKIDTAEPHEPEKVAERSSTSPQNSSAATSDPVPPR